MRQSLLPILALGALLAPASPVWAQDFGVGARMAWVTSDSDLDVDSVRFFGGQIVCSPSATGSIPRRRGDRLPDPRTGQIESGSLNRPRTGEEVVAGLRQFTDNPKLWGAHLTRLSQPPSASHWDSSMS